MRLKAEAELGARRAGRERGERRSKMVPNRRMLEKMVGHCIRCVRHSQRNCQKTSPEMRVDGHDEGSYLSECDLMVERW